MNKQISALILISALCLSLFCGCGNKSKAESAAEHESPVAELSSKADASQSDQVTCAVYIYMCGSDLESEVGFATENLGDIKYEQIPDNVTVILETGGTTEWHNDLCDENCIQRWKIDSDGFTNLDNLPLSSMGDEETLESFLSFCCENYNADRTMLMFWDHGGGTCGGTCDDENFPNSATLSIRDIHTAISNTFGADENNPPLSLLAFDCCLMATLDVAQLFSDEASYLLASEEVIPGGGYNYKTFMKLFKDNPNIAPEELGKGLIDGYSKKYIESEDPNGIVTLSLTDLSKASAVSSAVGNMMNDLLKETYSNPGFFVDISITADNAENYGGNSRSEGYYDLMDIKNFAALCEDLVPSAAAVSAAVEDAVLYKVNGEYRAYGGGLSMFYNYDASETLMESYMENGTNDAIKSFFSITGFSTVPAEEQEYVKDLGLDTENLPAIATFNSIDTSNTEVKKNSAGNYYVDFGREVGSCATDVMFELYCETPEGIYYLGSDDEVDFDFNEGIFINNFFGKWLRLGDYTACMELSVDTNEYNIYSIPILLVDSDGNVNYNDLFYLQFGYDFESGEWDELGVRGSWAEAGTARSFFLDEGDSFVVIQPTVADDGYLEYNPIAELQYSDDLISYEPLPSGSYKMCFKLEDVHKNILRSDVFEFEMADDVPVY